MPTGQEYWGVVTTKEGAPGINGGLMKRNMPGQPFTNYIGVDSIDAMNQTIVANGGVVVLPKMEIGPGMGWISAFTDPEHNLLGLHQAPPGMAAPPKKAKRAAKRASPQRGAAKRGAAKRSARKKASKRKRK
jgi:hypothetical protein